MSTQPSVALIRANGQFSSNEFLLQFFLSPRGQYVLKNEMAGQAITRLTLTKIKNLDIPLPPLEEQHKIAAILGTWDKAIGLVEALIAALQERKKGLMQLLLTGEVRFPEFDGEWQETTLGDVVEFLDAQRKPIKASNRADIQGEYPYYGASGIIDYVNDYIFDDDLILLGEDGENILSRNLPLAFQVSGKVWVNNHAHVMKPNQDMDIRFLTEYLESLNYEKYNSGTAQPKLNQKTCQLIEVVKPSYAEQQMIGETAENLDCEIELLQSYQVYLQKQKKGLMQQLLTGQVRMKVD